MLSADLMLGAALGGLIGFALSVPAIVIEWREKKKIHHLPILVDIRPSWWRGLTHRELFFVSLLQHLVFSTLFGLFYVVFVQQCWFFISSSPYSFWSLMTYTIGAWAIVGFLLFPLIGFGFFGKKEGGLVWAETLSAMLLLGVSVWLIMQWFQPSFCSI